MQAHILSPSDDVDSPSFVASCQYSFELFYLPPPPPPSSSAAAAAASSSLGSDRRIPDDDDRTTSSAKLCASAAIPATTAAETDPEDPLSQTHNARIPASDSDPPAIATASLPATYTATYLSPTWPESSERDRVLVRGWRALEDAVCWGRREQVMREAIRHARTWIEEEHESDDWELEGAGRISESGGGDGAT